MPRSLEQGIDPTVFHDHDDSVVLGALRGDQEPLTREYFAGLLRQLEVLCESYGVRPGDLGKKETQEKFSTADLTLARKLVATILATRRGELSAEGRREIGKELGEREAAAREMLKEAIAVDGMTEIGSEICARYLIDVEMAGEARAFYEMFFARQPSSLDVKLLVLESRRAALTDNARSVERMIVAKQQAERMGESDTLDMKTRMDGFMAWYDVYLPTVSNKTLLKEELRRALGGESDMCPIIATRVAIELEKRGLSRFEEIMMENLAEAVQDGLRTPFTASDRVRFYLYAAKLRHSHGLEGTSAIQASLQLGRNLKHSEVGYGDLAGEIAYQAGRIGAFAEVKKLAKERWWISLDPETPDPNLRLRVAEGCASVGNLDKAIELIRLELDGTERSEEYFDAVQGLLDAVLAANDTARADALLAEFLPGADPSVFRQTREYLAARARLGENVLFETRTLAEQPLVPSVWHVIRMSDDHRAISFTMVAVATIQFVEQAKKRLAV